MNDDFVQVIKDLEDKSFDFSQTIPLYNPMEEFVKYVKTKEVAHSKIIGDLLNATGAHRCRAIFLDSFLKKFVSIDADTISDINIVRERPVKRQYTSGDDRHIDIFIEYIDRNRDKKAIIIENKLNDAIYQPLQLVDYYEAIRQEGYYDIAIVCFHKRMNQDENNTHYKDIPIVIKYPGDLADWLIECIKKNAEDSSIPVFRSLYSYVFYLKNLDIKNRMLTNAKKILNLDSDLFQKVQIIGESYIKLKNDRLSIIKDILKVEYPKLKYRNHPHTSHIEIWDDEIWKQYNIEIVIWVDELSNGIFLASENRIKTEMNNDFIDSVNYCIIEDSQEWNYRWYESQDKNQIRYAYPDLNEFNRMISEIKRLLTTLFYPKDVNTISSK